MMIGKLNKRVTLLSRSQVSNSYGEYSDSFNEIGSLWANVNTLNGRELYQVSQVHSEARVKIIIRFRSDITPSMLIRFGSRILEIVSVTDAREEGRFLEVLCKEVV